jgi:probable HAF family extracellular repeat protein
MRPVSALPSYAITDLGTLGGSSSSATDINNRNQIVGSSLTAQGKTHAFRYTNGVGMEDLGVPPSAVPADSSVAFGINDQGEVAGTSGNAGFRYADGQGMVNLTTAHCGGLDTCIGGASEINNRGQVVGWEYSNATGVRRKAIRFADGVQKELFGVVAGDDYSEAVDINDSGQIAGFSSDVLNKRHAFRITNGLGMEFLGTLGGSINAGGEFSWNDPVSYANGINAKGQVTGGSSTTSLRWHGFLYTDGIGLADLGVLAGDDSSSGAELNDDGTVIGRSWNTGGGSNHPVLWSRPGCPEDLNSAPGVKGSGWILGEARAINNKGQIVGTGRNPQGQSRAYLLTPIKDGGEPRCSPASPIPGPAPSPGTVPAGGTPAGSPPTVEPAHWKSVRPMRSCATTICRRALTQYGRLLKLRARFATKTANAAQKAAAKAGQVGPDKVARFQDRAEKKQARAQSARKRFDEIVALIQALHD